jgi:anaerobic magnesium-protoporphyrin IX monomethyl ester cyclase
MRQSILLIYPGSQAHNPGEELSFDPGRSLPMGLLFLAASLERAGFTVLIHDARTCPKAATREWLTSQLERDPLFVGISAMTVQLGHGCEIAQQVRAEAPSVPVVWGGAHASLFPKTVTRDAAADYVVQGEADESGVLLAEALVGGEQDFDSIPGLFARTEDGSVVQGPRTAIIDVTSLPSPAYHLLQLEPYEDRRIPGGAAVRGVDILTSRGCPYRCAFCPNELLLGRRWRKRPIDQVLAEIDLLLSGGRINHVWFMDDLFIGDKERVVAIVEHLHRNFPWVMWEANVRADMFRDSMVDTNFLRFLKETGCVSLRMGAESGNDDVLRILQKDITVDQTVHAVAQCHDVGIVPVLFFMMGIPGETKEALFDTLQLMSRLRQRYPSAVVCGPGLFRPYPGGELYDAARKAGLKEPQDLAGWVHELGPQGFLTSTRLPWIDDTALIDDILFYMFHVEEFDRLSEFSLPWIRKLLARSAFWRAEHRIWGFRIEATIRRALRSMRGV